MERRGPYTRPEEDYGRSGYDYEGGPRFFPNGGGPRNYLADDRGYHGDSLHYPAERRAGPPSRRVRAQQTLFHFVTQAGQNQENTITMTSIISNF